MMTSFFMGLAAFFEATFSILETFKNLPNVLIIIVIAILLCFWIYYQVRVEEHDDRNYLSRR